MNIVTGMPVGSNDGSEAWSAAPSSKVRLTMVLTAAWAVDAVGTEAISPMAARSAVTRTCARVARRLAAISVVFTGQLLSGGRDGRMRRGQREQDRATRDRVGCAASARVSGHTCRLVRYGR